MTFRQSPKRDISSIKSAIIFRSSRLTGYEIIPETAREMPRRADNIFKRLVMPQPRHPRSKLSFNVVQCGEALIFCIIHLQFPLGPIATVFTIRDSMEFINFAARHCSDCNAGRRNFSSITSAVKRTIQESSYG